MRPGQTMPIWFKVIGKMTLFDTIPNNVFIIGGDVGPEVVIVVKSIRADEDIHHD